MTHACLAETGPWLEIAKVSGEETPLIVAGMEQLNRQE
jgi:hypothetical protein